MPVRADSNGNTWADLAIRGETLRVYGREFFIHIFTGVLQAKEGLGDSRGASTFVDSNGRTKRITLLYKNSSGALHREMQPGERLSMAFFVDDEGYDQAYFLLYDHTRRRAHDVSTEGIFDLIYEAKPRWWTALMGELTRFTYRKTRQYQRIVKLIEMREGLS